ncbi:MAG TPA: hypothetical protein VF401_01505 [Candidatus Saccharimonadales bacterium]
MRVARLGSFTGKHNLLTPNQSQVQTDASGWQNDTNATVSQSSAWGGRSGKSLAVTASAAGDVTARTTARPANPGAMLIHGTVASQVARNAQLGVRFLDGNGQEISRSLLNQVSESQGKALLPIRPPGYPNYAGYTTINLSNSNRTLNLDSATDYLLVCTEKLTGPVQITSGRNIVCIGCEIDMPLTYRGVGQSIAAYDTSKRAIYLNQQHGNVYFEGLYIHSSAAKLGDAIQCNANYLQSLTIQNFRFTDLSNYDGETWTDVDVAYGTSATKVMTGSPYAMTTSATTGYHDLTNNGTATMYVGTDNTVTVGTGTAIGVGATVRFDLAANVDLWAISTVAGSVNVNSGGNHPDGVQIYDSLGSSISSVNLYNGVIETNYQGLFFQSHPIGALNIDRFIVNGKARTKDGTFQHGLLLQFDAAAPSTRTVTNAYLMPVSGMQNKDTASGQLPQTNYPGFQEAVQAPFDPAPISSLTFGNYVTPGYV